MGSSVGRPSSLLSVLEGTLKAAMPSYFRMMQTNKTYTLNDMADRVSQSGPWPLEDD